MDPTDLYWHRSLLTTGTRKVIVIRIVGQDVATTADEAQLADDIFGASGDVLNLNSGYNGCSYGQLHLDPLSTNTLIETDGVYTVDLPNTIVAGSDSMVIANAALAQATTDLGESPQFLADHVMFCLPPGTSGDWIAYAWIAHWMSVYNDVWCQSPSIQIHEIGKSTTA